MDLFAQLDTGVPEPAPEAHKAAQKEAYASEEALLATAPVTIDGIRAVIEHLRDEDEMGADNLSLRYMQTLPDSPLPRATLAEAMVALAVGLGALCPGSALASAFAQPIQAPDRPPSL